MNHVVRELTKLMCSHYKHFKTKHLTTNYYIIYTTVLFNRLYNKTKRAILQYSKNITLIPSEILLKK